MRRRISIRGCVRPSVRRSVGPSVRPSPVIFRRGLGASCAVYQALFRSSNTYPKVPNFPIQWQYHKANMDKSAPTKWLIPPRLESESESEKLFGRRKKWVFFSSHFHWIYARESTRSRRSQTQFGPDETFQASLVPPLFQAGITKEKGEATDFNILIGNLVIGFLFSCRVSESNWFNGWINSKQSAQVLREYILQRMRLLHLHSSYHCLWWHLKAFYPQKWPCSLFENNTSRTSGWTYGRTDIHDGMRGRIWKKLFRR